MTNLRISGLPKDDVAAQTLQAMFGYRACWECGKWMIPENDPALMRGPPEALKMHHQIALDRNRFPDVAQKMVEVIPKHYEEFDREAKRDVPDKINIPGGFGLSTDLSLALNKVAFALKDELTECISETLLPIMVEKFNAQYVVPITVNAEQQQTYQSFAKVILLAQHHGSDKIKNLIEKKVSSGIAMDPLSILSCFDSLTRYAPIAFSMPVRRHGCSWHFYGDGFKFFNILATQGIFQELLYTEHPRSDNPLLTGLFGVRSIDKDNIWRLLRVVKDGLNHLFRFINDHRTYAASDGTINFLLQMQAFGGVRMLFSDLFQLISNMDSHSRITFTFGFLDKMANLKKHLGGLNKIESTISYELASLSQCRELRHLINKDLCSLRPELSQALLPAVRRCYLGIHRGLRNEIGSPEESESARIKRLNSYRNMNHGTFLNRSQFEGLYLESSGIIPREFVTLPYLLAFGLIANPSSFLSFDPEPGS